MMTSTERETRANNDSPCVVCNILHTFKFKFPYPPLQYRLILYSSMSQAPLESISITNADVGPDAGTSPVILTVPNYYYYPHR